MNLPFVLDVASWILMTAGGFFVFVGGVGALRMPDLYTRMHAASVTDTIGPLLIVAGLLLQSGLSLPSVKLLGILFFLLLTGPTASNALASAALLSGKTPDYARPMDEPTDGEKPE